MNGMDILGNLSNTVAPTSLTKYQPELTATNTTASPLTLSSNIYTVDLSSYSSTAIINSLYQKILTVTKTTASPLTLSNSILTIDLTSYSTTSANDSIYPKILTASLPLSLNTTTKILSIDLSSYQQSISVVAPLSLISNVFTVDLTAYQTTLTAVLPLVLNSTTKQLSFSTSDLSLSSFNKAIGCTLLAASGQVSQLLAHLTAQYLQLVLM